MDINKKQWYVRWFFFCLALIDEFMDKRDWRVSQYRHRADLCSFMRVSLLWGPAVILLHIAFYTAAIASVTYLPVQLFGFGGYGLIIGAIVALTFAVWLAQKVWSTWEDWSWQKQRAEALEAESAANEMESTQKEPSFASVVWSYMVAVKQKVCPIINFN